MMAAQNIFLQKSLLITCTVKYFYLIYLKQVPAHLVKI